MRIGFIGLRFRLIERSCAGEQSSDFFLNSCDTVTGHAAFIFLERAQLISSLLKFALQLVQLVLVMRKLLLLLLEFGLENSALMEQVVFVRFLF